MGFMRDRSTEAVDEHVSRPGGEEGLSTSASRSGMILREGLRASPGLVAG